VLTASEVNTLRKSKQRKPDEQELRKLPDRKALIHGRLSGFDQVKESKQSVREIAAQVDKAIADGYKTKLDGNIVESWLGKIQEKIIPPDVLEDGAIIVNCLGLGVSGTLSGDKRPDIKLDMDLLEKGEVGAIYVTEGANRLSRDQDRVESAVILRMMKKTNCKLRTPREVLSPCIERDWEIIHAEFERGADEIKIMNRRLSLRRESKAARGEFVGEPILPGFFVPVIDTRSNGSRIYGKYQRYAPHAVIVEKILQEFIKQALGDITFPLFPPELSYMERLSSLRMAKKINGVGYLSSPSMIKSLATNPRLVGWAFWGENEPIENNHEAAVPESLWVEAYQGAKKTIKPRGKGIKHEPMEWNGLLRCVNHDTPRRVSGHASKQSYRCETDYARGLGPYCFEIADQYLGRPLTNAVLQQLDFTPFAEEVLMRMQALAESTNLEEARMKKEATQLEQRIINLKENLGYRGGKHDRHLLEQIEESQTKLDQLKSRMVPIHHIPAIDYRAVKEFLQTLPTKWLSYSRTTRNRLLKRLIDHGDINHHGQTTEVTLYWKTGQVQEVFIRRTGLIVNRKSRWTDDELDTLKKLWPSTVQGELLAALPGRTWKAISDQANKQKWQRSRLLLKLASRKRWQPGEDKEGKLLYEEGVPVANIAVKLGRSCSALRQRASAKGWHRPTMIDKPALVDEKDKKQNPKVSKRITSGIVFGGQVRNRRLHPAFPPDLLFLP
jgi:hypothetical protein